MYYYILTQGTKSEADSLIIIDGVVLNDKDPNVNKNIIEKFTRYDSGNIVELHGNTEIVAIKRNKNNFLIEILSSNRDRVGRRVPVEIAIENYSTDIFIKNKLMEIPVILEREAVSIAKESLEMSIECIDRAIQKKSWKNRNIRIFTFTLLLIVLIVLSLKYFKWI